jgi:hypothetical protein
LPNIRRRQKRCRILPCNQRPVAALPSADLDEIILFGGKTRRAKRFFQDEDESARSGIDGEFLTAQRLDIANPGGTHQAQQTAVETHKKKEI